MCNARAYTFRAKSVWKIKIINFMLCSVLFALTTRCATCTKSEDENLLVQTDKGFVKGFIDKDALGRNIYSFKGIPFAKPPLNELRFKDPQPAEPWEGALDCTQSKGACPQKDGGSEDCLYLNVYTSKIPTEKNDTLLPVMFYIYGGAFRFGQQPEGPKYLLTKDIVLVEVNYRVNVFGFLSFEDPEIGIPGNAGLKDQNMGLRWVKNNIQNFGGDPNSVTLFGISAGGAAVNLQVLSPMSKGLFHRAISSSGVATCPWVFTKRSYRELSQALGCDSDNQRDIFQCIKQSSDKSILAAEEKIYNKHSSKTLGALNAFGPIIEEPNANSFLSERPEELLSKGAFNKVEFIHGFCKDEGKFWSDTPTFIQPNFKNAEDLIPENMNVQKGSNRSKTIGNRIQQFYYKDEDPSTRKDIFVKYVADMMFNYQIYYQAKIFAKHVPTYFYLLSYESQLNAVQNLTPHNSEFHYLFSNPKKPVDLNDKSTESTAVRRINTLWTNFAKTGNPNIPADQTLLNITWPTISPDNFQHLNIKPNLELGGIPFEERMTFWEDLYRDVQLNHF